MLIRIATRNSPLAINQALLVVKELQLYHRDIKFELLKLQTQGDILLDHSLSKIGGKGLFLKEIEQALIANAFLACVQKHLCLGAQSGCESAAPAQPVSGQVQPATCDSH